MITRDIEMAPPTTSVTTSSEQEHSRLGGIEDLKRKVGPVRRNLFGPVDHRQLRQDFQKLLCMSVEAANKRWDFDFLSDRPAQGSAIEWEALRCQDVPAFYRSCVRLSRAPKRASVVSPSSSEVSSSSSGESSGSGDECLETSSGKEYQVERSGVKRRQPSITDFFKVKRRRFLHYKGPSRQ